MPELRFEYFSSVKQRKIEWLWYPYIPYGKITILQGDPGEGKSTFILNIAALLTRGQKMPDGTGSGKAQTVIYQCAEDDIADTIKPRLLAAGADCNKIAYIIDDNSELTFEDARIEAILDKTGARLLVIDPIQAFLVQDSDMQSAARMRTALGKLADVAAKYQCAVVLVGHLRILKDGDLPSAQVYEMVERLDIKKRTVETAKKEVGIQAYRKNNAWYWRLPDAITSEAALNE